MGMYVNPGNAGFRRVLADEYVDKTGFIALVNAVIGTPRGLVCSTRPRRFGKTFAAESLVAYYTCGADSRELFEGLDISRDPGFERHLNAYYVVHLDMTAFRGARVGPARVAASCYVPAEARPRVVPAAAGCRWRAHPLAWLLRPASAPRCAGRASARKRVARRWRRENRSTSS